jgi:hypothetical protein
MTALTLGAAARQTGLSEHVLSQAIKDGRLIASRKNGWVYQIEQDDLARFSLTVQVERLTPTMRPGAAAASGAGQAASAPSHFAMVRRWLHSIGIGLGAARA